MRCTETDLSTTVSIVVAPPGAALPGGVQRRYPAHASINHQPESDPTTPGVSQFARPSEKFFEISGLATFATDDPMT